MVLGCVVVTKVWPKLARWRGQRVGAMSNVAIVMHRCRRHAMRLPVVEMIVIVVVRDVGVILAIVGHCDWWSWGSR